MGYVVWMDHHHSKYVKRRYGNGSLYIHHPAGKPMEITSLDVQELTAVNFGDVSRSSF